MQMAWEEVAKVLYCYYSRDSCKIVWKFPYLKEAKFTNRDRTFWDVLPVAPRERFRMLRSAKGQYWKLELKPCPLSYSASICKQISISSKEKYTPLHAGATLSLCEVPMQSCHPEWCCWPLLAAGLFRCGPGSDVGTLWSDVPRPLKPRKQFRCKLLNIKFGTLVATCQTPSPFRVSARTGWPSVSIFWTGETTNLIRNFSLSVWEHNCLGRSIPETHLHVGGILSRLLIYSIWCTDSGRHIICHIFLLKMSKVTCNVFLSTKPTIINKGFLSTGSDIISVFTSTELTITGNVFLPTWKALHAVFLCSL